MMKIALTVVIISFFGVFGKIEKLQMTSSWRPPATPGAKGSWTNAKSFTNVRVVDNLNGKSAWHTARTGTTAV